MLHLEVPDLSIRSLGRILERLEVGALRSEIEDVREGASLVDEREARTMALREALDAAIARGGENSADDLARLLDDRMREAAKAAQAD